MSMPVHDPGKSLAPVSGPVTLADLQKQLQRVESQLAFQEQQTRKLLRAQRLRFWLTLVLALLLCGAVAVLYRQLNVAYDSILQTSGEVNTLAVRVQEMLNSMDDGELETMLQSLPEISEKLSNFDVNAFNEVLNRLPALMDAVSELQQRMESTQGVFDGLSQFGNLFHW